MAKVIIAGSRTITDILVVRKAIEQRAFAIDELVHGNAEGVDRIAQRWAEGKEIPIKIFPAQWRKHDRAAGPIRNIEMAKYADCLIAIYDGKSKGTMHMIQTMNKLGKPVQIFDDKGNFRSKTQQEGADEI